MRSQTQQKHLNRCKNNALSVTFLFQCKPNSVSPTSSLVAQQVKDVAQRVKDLALCSMDGCCGVCLTPGLGTSAPCGCSQKKKKRKKEKKSHCHQGELFLVSLVWMQQCTSSCYQISHKSFRRQIQGKSFQAAFTIYVWRQYRKLNFNPAVNSSCEKDRRKVSFSHHNLLRFQNDDTEF